METVPVMAISVPLGQAQQWMRNGAARRQGGEIRLGSRRRKRAALVVKGAANFVQKLPTKQSNPSVGVSDNGLCLGKICQLSSLPGVDLCVLVSEGLNMCASIEVRTCKNAQLCLSVPACCGVCSGACMNACVFYMWIY